MNNIQKFCHLARKSVSYGLSRSISLANGPQYFQISPCLGAEPLKKKKRIDPAVVKAREERRKKKMEKAIRRLEKNQRQLKPIDETEVPLEYLDNKQKRQRPNALSPEKLEEFALLKKEWTRYRTGQILADAQMLARISSSQMNALEELRAESEELYQAAVKIDENLLPFTFTGPADTPPIENYTSPDGEYADVSKKWQ